MPFFSRGPALKQLSILFALHAAETEITEAQLYACVYSCCPMSWFEFCEDLPDLLKEGYVAEVPRAFGQCLRLTNTGRKALELFTETIPLSTRRTIQAYMEENREAFTREKQLVTTMEALPGDGQLIDLKALDGELTVLEIKLSVASPELALQMRSNWKDASGELYEIIWDHLMQRAQDKKQ